MCSFMLISYRILDKKQSESENGNERMVPVHLRLSTYTQLCLLFL